MPRIYFYKLGADNGGAPCVERGLLSLAICKPAIRRTAAAGDILIGFAANELSYENHLIYVAVVAERISAGEYYRKAEFAGRADCIYTWRENRFAVRPGARYHGDGHQLAKDVGRPPAYANAEVLLSRHFAYWGAGGPADYKSRFPSVGEGVEALGQGHRVRHNPGRLRELQRLIAEILPETGGHVLGAPASGWCMVPSDCPGPSPRLNAVCRDSPGGSPVASHRPERNEAYGCEC